MTALPDEFDVFLSHWTGDNEHAEALVAALEAKKLRVWFDEDVIDTHESITRAVRQGVLRSKVLVAYYSATYPERSACQWELVTAYIAAQCLGNPGDRILVVNPEQTEIGSSRSDHIVPVDLRDPIFGKEPEDATRSEAWADEASRIAEIASQYDDLLGSGVADAQPRQIGRYLVGSPSFVGRIEELWRIHSALTNSDVAIITGVRAGDVAELVGMGGMGKSMLAEEYGLRFGSRYPGGIFWLSAARAGDDADSTRDDIEAVRRAQLRLIAANLQIVTDGRSEDEVIAMIREELESTGPGLWIVDDLPGSLTTEQVRNWRAPAVTARTLLITRSRRYEIAQRVELDRLSTSNGFSLLTAKRQPESPVERGAAVGIVEDLGGHPLALAVAAHILKRESGLNSFSAFRDRLASPSNDALELAERLQPELPTGHQASVAATLLESIEPIATAATDVLRIAGLLAAAPIPKTFLVDVLACTDTLDPGTVRERTRDALTETDQQSLTKEVDPQRGTVFVHELVSRTVRLSQPDTGRERELLQSCFVVLHRLLVDGENAPADPILAELAVHARVLISTPTDDSDVELAQLALRQATAQFEAARGDYQAAERDQIEILNDVERLHGPVARETVVAAAELAGTLVKLNDLGRARPLLEQAAQVLTALGNPDDPLAIGVSAKLFSLRNREGEIETIREPLEDLLHEAIRVSGRASQQVAAVASNLARVWYQLGRLGQARELLTTVIDDRRAAVVDDDAEVIALRAYVAVIRVEEGHPEDGIEPLEECVADFEEIYGESNPETLRIRGNLAMALWKRNTPASFTRAKELLSDVLSSQERLLGANHPQTLMAMDNQASTLRELGDAKEACRLAEAAVEGLRKVLPGDNQETLIAIGNLGINYDALGEFELACQRHREALEGFRRLLPPGHSYILKAESFLSDAEAALEAERTRDIGRNDPCWCGSGKKYKKCHGA